MIGKLFERILLTRNSFEIGRHSLLCNEQFGFGAKHSTAVQLTLLIGRVSRNFGEKRLRGAVFLDMAKAFHTVWDDGLVCKLTVLNFSLVILSKLCLPTRVVGRLKRPSKQPDPLVFACGLV
jgi:hypothetical protein